MEEGEPQGLRRQFNALTSAPLLFVVALIVVAAAIWGALQFSYRGVLSSKDRYIALLERRLGEYREAVGGATADEARRRIEAMDTEIKTLRLRLNPRRLTPDQRQAIVDRSRLPSGAQVRAVTVAVERDCVDCAAFAEGIAMALRDSQGWTISSGAPAAAGDRTGPGLAVRVGDRLRPSPDAIVLQQALRSAGLEFAVVGGGMTPNVELLVTERLPQ